MPDVLHILIPFYNSSATIGRTIRSLGCIAPANRDRVQIIAVDDGSTDSSRRILEETFHELGSITYNLIQKPNGGSASARNLGLKAIQDGWVFFLDADDELATDPIPLLSNHLDQTAVLFATEIYRDGVVKSRMTPTIPDPLRFTHQFSSQNLFHPSMVVFRRNALKTLFDETLVFLEDWHFWAANPDVFSRCARHSTIHLGRVHVCHTNKSSDAYNNGRYRILAADRIAAAWAGRLDSIATNNLDIQKAIGAIQMKGGRTWRALTRLPSTPSLYAKLLVYFFLFPLYQKFNPYAR